MKPQQQQRKEENGDCLRACIATLLDIRIDKIPDFAKDAEHLMMTPVYAIQSMQKWLADLGLSYIEIALPPNMPWYHLPLPVLCILLGETKAGVKHAIVGRCEGAEFFPVWNPWPEAGFADGVASVAFLMPRDPSLPVNFGRALDKIAKSASAIGGAVAESICAEANQVLGLQSIGLEILPS